MKVKTFDHACYDLARQFVQDAPKGTTALQKEADARALAIVVQQAVEDWFEQRYGY